MVLDELRQEPVRSVGHGVVEADAAAHEDLLHAGNMAQVAQQVGVSVLVDDHVLAYARPQAAAIRAHAVLALLVTGGTEEVGRGPAHVGDITLEVRIAGERLRLADDALAAAHLQRAALMERERAERALPEAPAIGRDGELDLGERRHAAGLIVVGVPGARVRKLVDRVHLLGRKQRRRRVLHHVHPMRIGLHKAVGGDVVHVAILDGEAARVRQAVGLEIVPRGEQLVIVDLGKRLLAAAHTVDRAVDIRDLVDGQARGERVGHLDDGVLAHAVQHEVGAGIEQDAALEGVGPVIVVGEAAQARLDAAQDDGDVLE